MDQIISFEVVSPLQNLCMHSFFSDTIPVPELNIPGILPVCQSALQPWVSLGLLYNWSPPGVRFLNRIIFYRMGLLAPYPTPILEDQDVSLSLDSTL
jgi:hypothetical protein